MEWKAEYGLVFFFVFCGAIFRLSVDKKNEYDLNLFRQIMAQLVAVLFGGSVLIGIFLMWLDWPVTIPALLGIPTGIQAEKFLMLYFLYGQQSAGFIDFIARMKVGYKAMKNFNANDEEHEKP